MIRAGRCAPPRRRQSAIAWFVFVPGAFISVHYYGAGDVVAMLWLVAYLCLLAVVLTLRFMTGRWRKIEMTEGMSLH